MRSKNCISISRRPRRSCVVVVVDNTSVLELAQMTLRFRVELSFWSSEFPWMLLKIKITKMLAMDVVEMVLVHWTMLNRALSRTR